MVQQIEITLKPKSRGFHLVTSEILSQLPKLPKTGIVNIFTKHTSCGPHHRWQVESRHLAGNLLLRVPQLWRLQRVGSNNYRRIKKGTARPRVSRLYSWAIRPPCRRVTGPDGQHAQFHTLQTERDADDGNHQYQSCDEILNGSV